MQDARDIIIKHNKQEQTLSILNRLLEGQTVRQIAKEMDLSTSWIYEVKRKYLGKKGD